MPQVELTTKFCESAKPIGTQTDWFDTAVPGLCLRVSAKKRSWNLIYTDPRGKRARMGLGKFPAVSLSQARQKAREARAAIHEGGGSPNAVERAQAASLTVSDLVESYVTRRAAGAKRGDEIARRLRYDVVPLIGDVKLDKLHRRDITRCIDAVMDRGAKAAANRLFDDLRAMVRWAKARGDIDENLVDGMRRPAESAPRDRVLDPDEILTIWNALPEAVMAEGTRRLLRLCLLTAQRVGELCGMTRDELDLENRVWKIPAARSKNSKEHTVPLSETALSIIQEQIADLDALAVRVGREPSAFMFPGPGGRTSITNSAVGMAVRRPANRRDGNPLGIAHWTPHDLRRTAATLMEESGVSPFVVGHVLNHVSITKASITSRVYARYDYAREKREALDILAGRVAGIVSSKDKVVALRGA